PPSRGWWRGSSMPPPGPGKRGGSAGSARATPLGRGGGRWRPAWGPRRSRCRERAPPPPKGHAPQGAGGRALAIGAPHAAGDEAILGVSLAGGNTRRIKGALAPLLGGGPLSKDAVSRLVGRLREDFETWRTRDLADEDLRYVFMDGWYPKVRIGGRRERVPVL